MDNKNSFEDKNILLFNNPHIQIIHIKESMKKNICSKCKYEKSLTSVIGRVIMANNSVKLTIIFIVFTFIIVFLPFNLIYVIAK